MFQTTLIIGNVGRDPEMRYTPEGKAVCSFSVAVSDGFGDRKTTLWFRVSAWGSTAEACNQYLKKGSRVLVEGRLQADANGNPRIWQDQSGTPRASFEISAATVRFLSSNSGAAEQAEAESEIPF